MKIAIMQPYFFPYIGYFQLINAVDEFIIYDNIQYTKKGWINRNRILSDGKPSYMTLTLKNANDFLDVDERFLSNDWGSVEKKKMLNRVCSYYKKAPEFNSAFSLFEKCLNFENTNLFEFLLNSLEQIKQHIGITTPFVKSSAILIDHSLKNKNKVIALCKERKATHYINPIGGVDLYDKNEFGNVEIDLSFIKADTFEYKQFNAEFVPWLSILDVMMFNDVSKIKNQLSKFTLK